MPFDAASAYRRNSARGLTLTGLVVQAYDQIIASLNRAIGAIEARNIEQKTDHLNHALTLVAYLQRGLNFEAGGEVAQSVEHFYNVERTQILKASAELSTEILRGVVERFISMREAWHKVDLDTRASESRPRATDTRPNPAPSAPRNRSYTPVPDWQGDQCGAGWSA